jgi:hypothetical protein
LEENYSCAVVECCRRRVFIFVNRKRSTIALVSTIYNYADDNTLSYADHDLKNVISKLESDSQKMLDWFAKMSLIKILKRMGPKIEPCDTPLYTVSKELQIFFTFTHCFLPDK